MCGSCSRWLLEATTFPEPPRPSTAWFTNSAWRGGPRIGAMIETPAALFALEEILEVADFVAIGTNDLTEYMLATDRDAADLTEECTPMHPAVLRAIKQVIEVAGAKHRPVCVCGEEAGDADFACLLAGLGIRELSMSPLLCIGLDVCRLSQDGVPGDSR